jgi:hypothetical protein
MWFPKRFAVLTCALGALSLACKPEKRSEDSNAKGLVVSAAMGETAGAGSQVVLYYANETVPRGPYATSYRRIVNALKNNRSVIMAGPKLDDDPQKDERKKDKLSKDLEIYAQRIEDDKACFASLVDEEVAELTKALCDDPANKNVSLVVFRSTLMQEGRFIYCQPGQGAKSEAFTELARIQKVRSASPIVDSNPAVYAGTLMAAIRQMESALKLEKGKAQINLILKSHGYSLAGKKGSGGKVFNDLDHSIVAVPRLPIYWSHIGGKDATSEDKQKIIIEIFKGALQELGRVPRPSCPPTRSQGYALGSEGLGAEGMGVEGMGIEGMGIEGMGIEGMGIEGMGIEGMGAEGMGIEGMGIEGMGAEGMGAERIAGSQGGTTEALVASTKHSGGWITKRLFLQMLANAGHAFPVVLTESCSSYWGDAIKTFKAESQTELPIGYIVGSGKDDPRKASYGASTVAYKNIDYAVLLPKVLAEPSKPFAEVFIAYLNGVAAAAAK